MEYRYLWRVTSIKNPKIYKCARYAERNSQPPKVSIEFCLVKLEVLVIVIKPFNQLFYHVGDRHGYGPWGQGQVRNLFVLFVCCLTKPHSTSFNWLKEMAWDRICMLMTLKSVAHAILPTSARFRRRSQIAWETLPVGWSRTGFS